MSGLMEPGLRPEAGTERATLILAPNADPMTLDGTNTWLLAEPGARRAVVVDPGPLHEDHLRLVLATAEERELRIGLILLTHGHFDHSEGAPRLAELTGAPVRALDPRFRLGDEGLAGGDVVDMDGLRLDVIATPGHSGDSMCFLLPGDRAVLTGDTILGRGTTVVAHPDGRLGDYLGTLHRLRDLAASHDVDTVLPGHGPVPADALGVVEFYLEHRRQRLEQVRTALAGGDETAADVVATVYAGVDRAVLFAAEMSVRAQLEYLHEQG